LQHLSVHTTTTSGAAASTQINRKIQTQPNAADKTPASTDYGDEIIRIEKEIIKVEKEIKESSDDELFFDGLSSNIYKQVVELEENTANGMNLESKNRRLDRLSGGLNKKELVLMSEKGQTYKQKLDDKGLQVDNIFKSAKGLLEHMRKSNDMKTYTDNNLLSQWSETISEISNQTREENERERNKLLDKKYDLIKTNEKNRTLYFTSSLQSSINASPAMNNVSNNKYTPLENGMRLNLWNVCFLNSTFKMLSVHPCLGLVEYIPNDKNLSPEQKTVKAGFEKILYKVRHGEDVDTNDVIKFNKSFNVLNIDGMKQFGKSENDPMEFIFNSLRYFNILPPSTALLQLAFDNFPTLQDKINSINENDLRSQSYFNGYRPKTSDVQYWAGYKEDTEKLTLIIKKQLYDGTRQNNTNMYVNPSIQFKEFSVSNGACKEKTLQLMSVIMHRGGPFGGHYIAVNRHGNQWIMHDDENITPYTCAWDEFISGKTTKSWKHSSCAGLLYVET